jgi:hypothetical protein
MFSTKKATMKKPIDSTTHGIIDYALAGAQLFLPALLHLHPKAVKTYQVVGLGMLGLNALTNTSVGLKPVVALKDHQKADTGLSIALGAMTASKMVHKNRRALAFHLIFSSIVAINYFLTDYNEKGE